ncbi:MAG: hypothetical protein ACM3MK_09365 [Chitinophagales bacterium]
MWQKIKNHIEWLQNLERQDLPHDELRLVMGQIIEIRKYFQHERLIHLLVTLGFAIVVLFVFYMFITQNGVLYAILLLILALLEAAYVVHYYRLENGVQQIWEIEKRLNDRLWS